MDIMSTIIIIAVVIGVITLFNIHKELHYINVVLQDWRNNWEKQHGRYLSNGVYKESDKTKDSFGP